MKLSLVAGTTSKTVNIFIQDSSSSTGEGLAGLLYNTSGLTAYYALPRAAATSITLDTLAAVNSAYASGGFKEIDASHMKGWYRFDIPNAALASGAFTSIHLYGAADMVPLPIEIELTAWNNQDSVRGGLTALPNAAAEAAGGLYTRGTGAGQVNQTVNGQSDAYTTLSAAQAEPGQGTPAVNASVVSKMAYLYKAWRNKTTQTASQYSLFADDASTVDQKATFADNGTTATKGEVATGP